MDLEGLTSGLSYFMTLITVAMADFKGPISRVESASFMTVSDSISKRVFTLELVISFAGILERSSSKIRALAVVSSLSLKLETLICADAASS
ncbi:MAG: hypothetical protein BWY32_02078 [bacterium ADurb.Bin243]|nr:MAG: hypothetical protein BWY32_02078 [bacterium ADurb.Bin243]